MAQQQHQNLSELSSTSDFLGKILLDINVFPRVRLPIIPFSSAATATTATCSDAAAADAATSSLRHAAADDAWCVNCLRTNCHYYSAVIESDIDVFLSST